MSKATSLARYGNSDPGRGYGKSASYAANAVLTSDLAGAVVDNRDATTPIVLTLMPAVAGISITFCRLAPYTGYLRPYAGDTIKGLTDDLAVNGAMTVVLSCTVTGEWDVLFSGLLNVVNVDEYWPATGGAREAITAAWDAITEAGGGVLQFTPGKEYDIGSINDAVTLWGSNDLDVCIIQMNGAKITCNTTADVLWTAFSFNNCKVLHILGHGEWEDTGFDPTVTWRGVRCFSANVKTDGETYGPYTAEVKAKNVVSPYQVFRDAGKTSKIAGLRFHIFADHCYYGCGVIGEVLGISGTVVCDTVRRAWITYGPVRGDVDVVVSHDYDNDYQSNAGVEIATSDGEQVAGDLTINLKVSGRVRWGCFVVLDNQTTGTNYGAIKDVTVNYDLSAATWSSTYLLKIIASYRTSNTQVTETWDRITLKGDAGAWDSDAEMPVVFENWPVGGCIDISGLKQRYPAVRQRMRMAFKDGQRSSTYAKYGDLTSGVLNIPFAAVNAAGSATPNHAMALKVTSLCVDDTTAVAAAKFTYSEDIVFLDMVTGSLNLLGAVHNVTTQYQTTDAVIAIGVSGANLTWAAGAAAYNGANAMARVTVELLDRFGSIA